MDDLLHFVRHEVAMDGDDGTPIDRLDGFIHTYYARAAEDSNNDSLSSTIKTQNIDESFKDFIWKQLASLPELKVAFLRKVGQQQHDDPIPIQVPPEAEASTSAILPTSFSTPDIGSLPPMPLPEYNGPDDASTPIALPPLPPASYDNNKNNSGMLLDEDGNIIDQGTFNLKNKAKIKALRKDNQKRDRNARLDGNEDQYEFIEIADEEIQNLNRRELAEKYGDTLRIAADPETCYVGLTGSHERYGKLTLLAYQVLQAIARGRENGKTVVDLGKEFEHDQKSLFHFVKSLVELNLIVKMKISDARSQTSRCIHRHYLETSQHWATWMTKDPNQGAAKGEDNDDDDDLGKTTPLTIMTTAHLNTNEPLVRSRILNALRSAPENLIPHVDLVFAIGFRARPGHEERRRLNRIITSMVRQGLVEKVGVARQGTRGLLSCLKLCTSRQTQEGEDMATQSLSEEDEVEERPNLLLTLPIERQVVDLLVSSGAQGLTIRELQAGLGDVGTRSLETLLIRMEKNVDPPHLCDYRIQSVYETHGREKRLRYFTTAGYHERCRLDGLGDIVNMSDFTHPDLAGGFSVLDTSDFYATPEDFAEMSAKMLTNTRPGVKYGAAAKAKGKGQHDLSGPVKRGRPKGTTKKAKEAKPGVAKGEASVADAGDADGEREKQEEEEGKTKKRRPKKEKVDGEEGQPPKKKGRPRKNPQAQDGQSQQADSNTEGPVAGPSGTSGPQAQDGDSAGASTLSQPKKKGRPRKNAPAAESQPAPGTTVPSQPVADSSTGTPAGSEAPLVVEEASQQDISATLPKKKGRPRKSASAAESQPAPGTPVPSQPAADSSTGTPAGSEAPLVAEEASQQDISAAPPKKKGRPPKVHTEDDVQEQGKKRKAEIGSDGQTLKGRPRKYPPGTTAVQRKILLKQRRLAGLEPPSKKAKKGNSQNSENGSVAPSEGTPGPEDIPVPVPPSPGAQVPYVQESAAEQRTPIETASEQSIPAVEHGSQASASPLDLNTSLTVPAEPREQNSGQELTHTAPSGNNGTIFEPASFGGATPNDPLLTSTDIGIMPLTDVMQLDTAHPAPVSPPAPSIPQLGKRKTGPRKISLPDMATTDGATPVTKRSANIPLAAPSASQEPVSAAEADTSVRRSKRQKTGDAPATVPVKIRRGRSSKILPDNISVKAQEPSAVPTLQEAQMDAPAVPEPDRQLTPTLDRVEESSTEVQPVSVTPSHTMPIAQETVAPVETLAEHPQVEEAAPSISQVKEADREAQSALAPEQVTSTMALDEGYASKAIDTAVQETNMSVDLPAMPVPLPAATLEIAPNVTAKPVNDTNIQDRVLERRNHSMQVHENEYVAALQDIGGIAEEGLPLDKMWQDFMQRKNPNKPPPKQLDRRTIKGIVTSLEKRGIVKRSILQFQNFDGKMVQRHVMYLPSISLDSPQMRDFAIHMHEKLESAVGAPKSWLANRKTLDKTDEMVIAPRRGRRPIGEVPTDARPFFMRNWRIVAQYFGWQYGFLARARTLHIHLVKSITDDNDSTFIVSSDPRVRIFASPFVLLDTPLSIFMQIAAVSEYSADLEEFLKQDGAGNAAIKNLPPALSGLFGAKRAKGYSRFSQLFEVLMLLKLLVPIEQVDYETPIVAYSGTEREPRYFAARQERSGAAFWLLPGQAPIYDLQEKKGSEQKLLGQLPVQTPEQAVYFWDTLHKLTFGVMDPDDLPSPTVKYPPTLNAPFRFIFAARTSCHWRAEYLLLAQQKTYLRRSLEAAASKDALLSNGAKIEELAYNVVAPVDIVRSYYAKPHLGARPEWAKKRKRRPTARQGSNDSETSASEAEGPGAPMPRSERADQAKSERRKSEKAARIAAKLLQQREIIDMKARGISQAKQAVWDGIINGFRMQHGEEALKTLQLDFLRNWFLSNEGPTATTIQQHLEQAIEGSSTAPITISSRAILAPKTGSVANRGQEHRMKTKPRWHEGLSGQNTNPEDEVVLRTLPELPEVIPSDEKKTPKAGWTPEEDEQLMDLYVILQSRANDRDTRLSMEPATLFYPGVKAKLLVHRLRCLAANAGEVAYLDALQDAWSRLWHGGRIRDPLLHDAARNASKEGLILLRRVLNGALNKQSLRFQALMPAEAAAASQTRLPSDPNELKKSFLIDFKAKPEDPESPQTWEYLWSTVTTAQKSVKFNYQPFRTSYEPRLSAPDMTSQERVKMFDSRYKPFSKVPANYVKDAEAFEMRLVDEGVVDWSPICEDGDMLAMAHLFSENLLTFSVDTSVTRAGRPYTDYRTRKTDDDNFENSLIIQPNEAFLNRKTSIFTSELVKSVEEANAEQNALK